MTPNPVTPLARWLLAWLLLVVGGAVQAAVPAGPGQWLPAMEAFARQDQVQPPPQQGVLFIGSSSINYWHSLAEDFPGVPVINRGFGGSAIEDSTYYAGRIVTPYHPRLIVMYAGDNDVYEGHAAQQVADDFKAFVARVRKDLPAVPVVYISIKPSVSRWALWPAMREANGLIRDWVATQRGVSRPGRWSTSWRVISQTMLRCPITTAARSTVTGTGPALSSRSTSRRERRCADNCDSSPRPPR